MNHVQAQHLIAEKLWMSGVGSKVGGMAVADEIVTVLEKLGVQFEPTKPTVLVVRDPDEATSITVSPEGSVTVVEVDLGSSFNGQPTDTDEADSADEIADRLGVETNHLPVKDPVRQAAIGIIERLREQADEARS